MDSQYHYYVEPGAVGEDPFISLEVGETQETKTHILRSILSPAKGEKKKRISGRHVINRQNITLDTLWISLTIRILFILK